MEEVLDGGRGSQIEERLRLKPFKKAMTLIVSRKVCHFRVEVTRCCYERARKKRSYLAFFFRQIQDFYKYNP